MSQTREQQAYQRGIRAARLWQRLKGTILRWDRLCVSKARERKLPAWFGHIPMTLLVVCTLTILTFCGVIIAGSAVLTGALILLLSSSKNDTDTMKMDEDDYANSYLNNDFGTKYRSGSHGWGWYDSTGYMHDEDN